MLPALVPQAGTKKQTLGLWSELCTGWFWDSSSRIYILGQVTEGSQMSYDQEFGDSFLLNNWQKANAVIQLWGNKRMTDTLTGVKTQQRSNSGIIVKISSSQREHYGLWRVV